MEEIYKDEKIEVKLTRKELEKILNGKIIEGFKLRIGRVEE
jgi:hypothetical protein